ncbi:MAG TPA: ROK family protein [Candidatus Krumholzibacteria bacterium]|nr:ROK family protein [Candidatus Krumholzibacteria bacterium]
MKQYLGIDIGGTNIKLATVSDRGAVIARGLIETHPDDGARRAFERIHAAARLLGRDGIQGVGIGCAGLFDDRRGRLTASPNLKEWEGAPLARIASPHFPVPILIQNDATCAAYGESLVRRRRGSNLVLITLGTGVGGGIVSEGRVVRGASGFGGEIGHIVVDPNGPRCHCGSYGCLEALVGSYGIVRTARRLRRKTGHLSGWGIFHAARGGQRWARETVRITGEHLGTAVATLLNTLNPAVIVFGGGGAGGFDLLYPHVMRSMKRHTFREMLDAVRLEPARLGNDAGMIGAAMLVRDTISTRHPRR